MGEVFVLIMVMIYSTTGVATLKQEFNSAEACRVAQQKISQDVRNSKFNLYVISEGCYKR